MNQNKQNRIRTKNINPAEYTTKKRVAWLRNKYEITVEQYDKMLEIQNNVCAICHVAPKTKRLEVDHDHKTKRVRGLLCWWCNQKLVVSRHTPELLYSAIKYLVRDFDGRLI